MNNVNVRHWVGILFLMALSVISMNTFHHLGTSFISILDLPEHPDFDGTVYPIQKVPDWTHLTSEEYEMAYNELPLNKFLASPPTYSNDYFSFPSSDLKWGNTEHDKIRNSKITYSVPYAGTYEFGDFPEGSGSHPAVDIKVLSGTPIHSIANGVVSDEGLSSGWGYYIVVLHRDVPNPSNPSQKVNMFCSYSHMEEPAFANEGDVVLKNEVIGAVGMTGTATVEHVHFQCDAESASFHPYWPFTNAEAAEAGYSFWEAVNNGLGQDKVYAHTYNPMKFVLNNLDGDAPEIERDTETDTELIVEEEEEEEVEITPEPEPETDQVSFNQIEFDVMDMMMVGDEKQISLTLLDSQGDKVESNAFDGELVLSLSDPNLAELSRTRLELHDFENGSVDLNLFAEREGEITFTASIAGNSFTSPTIHLITSISPFSKFGALHDGGFTENREESIQIVALDPNGKPTPDIRGDGTVEIEVIEGAARLSKEKIPVSEFRYGVAHLTLNPLDVDDIVLRVTYGTAVSESEALEIQTFSDLYPSDPSYEAIVYLSNRGVINGYPDGTFRPDALVNRVEALKLIFEALDAPIENLEAYFPDIQTGQWYSSYLGTAVNIGVAKGYPDGTFKPLQNVNKVEFLKMMFILAGLDDNQTVDSAPYPDVPADEWFSAYVQYAKVHDLFPLEGSDFLPDQSMTRREVAEVLYRHLQGR